LLTCYPLAYVYRFNLSNDPNLIYVKHIFGFGTGFVLSYFTYGKDAVYPLLSVLVTWVILKVSPSRQISLIIGGVGNLAYLLAGYWIYSTEGYDLDWTVQQCVLCLRLIGLCWDYYDGGKPEAELKLEKDQMQNKLIEVPSLLETLAFSFFFPSFMTGPQFTFRLYSDFVTLKLFGDSKVIPDSTNATIKCFGLGIMYLVLNQVMSALFPVSAFFTESFAKSTYFYKILHTIIAGRHILWKYLGVWLLAEGSCILVGIGYAGVDKFKNPQWNGLSNVLPLKFETTTTLAGTIQSFNINTNDWVKRYVFKRLKFLGNRQLSNLGAMLYLAIWHGFAPGYFIAFILEFF